MHSNLKGAGSLTLGLFDLRLTFGLIHDNLRCYPVYFRSLSKPRQKGRKMRIITCLCLLSILAADLVGCGGGPLWTKTITITQQQIEDKMVGKFPMHKENRLIKSDFTNPKVYLTPGSDRVSFGLDVEIEFLRETYTGQLMMNAGLEYASDKGSFYLVDSQIETLNISGLKQKAAKAVLKSVVIRDGAIEAVIGI